MQAHELSRFSAFTTFVYGTGAGGGRIRERMGQRLFTCRAAPVRGVTPPINARGLNPLPPKFPEAAE